MLYIDDNGDNIDAGQWRSCNPVTYSERTAWPNQSKRDLMIRTMTNKITSQWLLCWARRANVERAQRVILDATKESKESETIKRHDQQSNVKDNTKRTTEMPQNNYDTAVLYISCADLHRMVKPVQLVAESNIVNECAGYRVERCQIWQQRKV